jgi:hypothetical protein
VKACDKLLTNRRLDAVTDVQQARLLAVAIELREDPAPQREALMATWERVTFRIFGMYRKDARTRVGDYVRLARDILSDKVSADEVVRGINGISGKEFAIEGAVRSLKDTNCYEGWERELRYFMFRYEEYLVKRRGQKFESAEWERIWSRSPKKSIEHILPQSDVRKGTSYIHRLGNLTLLPPQLNSQLRDDRPKAKADEYAKTGLLVASTLHDKLATWDRAAIEAREHELLEWASTEWR